MTDGAITPVDMNTNPTVVTLGKSTQHSGATNQGVPPSMENITHRTKLRDSIQQMHRPPPFPILPPVNTANMLPTPINVSAFAYLLEGYEYKEFIVNGFSQGFMTHFVGEEKQILDCRNSTKSLYCFPCCRN